ncbi:MAG: hypothetical protein QXO15_08855 [Nitrososphaerota archaeon]
MRKLTYALSALIAAMLLMGIAYSLWSTSVVISGTINTGTVEGKWISAESDDIGIDPEWDKDVGYVEFEGLGTSLVVIVGNTYPCYTTTIVAIYEYTGTVPAIVNSTIVETIGWEPASSYGANDGPVFLEILYNVTVGTQLHQGDRIEVVIKVHVEQCAEQDASYLFTVEMELIQWNEYTPPIPPAEVGTVYLYPDGGEDTTDSPSTLSSSDLEKLKAADDNKKYCTISTWLDQYSDCERLDFTFENMSAGINIVSIDNVILRFKWTRPRTIDHARIIIYFDSNSYIYDIALSELPGTQCCEERTEVINLKNLGVDTVGEINSLKIRFQATDGEGAYTCHDLVEVEVTYTYTQ